MSLASLLLVLPALSPSTSAQEPVAQEEQALVAPLARFEAYLARKPFHAAAFEQLVDAAVATNALAALVERYEELAAAEPGGEDARATRVVLARLYARTERSSEAIEILDAIAPRDGELAHLLGSLYLAERRADEAVAALDEAARTLDDRKLLERVHADRGAAWLLAGDPDAAAAAFGDLAAIEPENYHLRIAAAEAMTRGGLSDRALTELGVAADLAGDNTAQRCRALAAQGELLEQLERGEEALAVYGEAEALLGRGHWLKRDLLARTLALHRRAGTLEDLAQKTRALIAANPRDLDRRELLADLHLERAELGLARTVLEDARREFPDDLTLGRRWVEVLERAEDGDALVAAYQALIERHPGELELYIELGRVFATGGRFEQARRQWEKSLEQRLTDAGFCVRLANLYALFEMHDEAERTLERAIELEPGEMGHFVELAGLRVRAGRRDQLDAVLDRAERVAGADPGRLEALADLARGLRRTARARRAIEVALETLPDDVRLLRTLADLCIVERDRDAATEALERVLSVGSGDANARRDAARRLVRLYARHGDLTRLRGRMDARLSADATDAGALYVLARIDSFKGRRRPAARSLEALLAAHPEDSGARGEYARLLTELGEDEAAIAQYGSLIERRPAMRANYLKDIARIHVDARRPKDAIACYDEILVLSPDNPAAFVDIAGRFSALREHERAAECMRQALRLAPADGRYRLKLADLYVELDDEERALAEVLLATADEDADVRNAARAWLYEQLVDDGRVDDEIAEMRQGLAANPYDIELASALVDLFVRELEYELALEIVSDLLAYRPRDAELLGRRAELYESLRRFDLAREDYETLRRLPRANRSALALALARCALGAGDERRAEELLLGVEDPATVVSLFQRYGLYDRAAAAIERALLSAPDDRAMLERLVRLYEERGQLDEAIAAHERLLDLDGLDWERLEARALLLLAADDQEQLRECARLMLSTLETPVSLETSSVRSKRLIREARRDHRRKISALRNLLSERGLESLFVEAAHAHLVAAPHDEELFGIVVSSQRRTDPSGRAALATVEAVRAATLGEDLDLPAGRDERAWTRELDRTTERLINAHPELAAARSAELGERPAEELSEKELRERIDLLAKRGDTDELLEALEVGVARFPEDIQYRSDLALTLVESRRTEQALPVLRELLVALEARKTGTTRTDDPEEELSGSQRLARRLPTAERDTLDSATLATLYRLARKNPVRDGWDFGRRPDALAARLELGRTLADLLREDEAREVLLVLEPRSAEFVEWQAFMADLYVYLDWAADTERVSAALLEVLERVASDPDLRRERRHGRLVREVVVRHARTLEQRGELVDAYELTRLWSGAEQARAMRSRLGIEDELKSAMRARYDTAKTAGDADRARICALLLVELVATHAGEGEELAAGIELVRELRAAGGEELSLVATLAAFEERAGRPAEALRLWRESLERARALYEESGEKPDPRPVAAATNAEAPADPYRPIVALERSGPEDVEELIAEISEGMTFYRTRNGEPDFLEYWVEIFRLELLAREWSAAAVSFEAIVAGASGVAGYVSYELRQALDSLDAGDEALDLWRKLYDGDPTQKQTVLSYGSALVAADQSDEAMRAYRKFLRQHTPSDYGYREVQSALGELDPTAATAAASAQAPSERSLPTDLAQAVAEDPKNVRLIVAYARRLASEGEFGKASEQALVAESLAPHRDDVRELATSLLVTLGRDDEVEQRQELELRNTTDLERRIVLCALLADRAWERGELERAREILRSAGRGQSLASSGYSMAHWYLSKGLYDEALATLEDDRRRLGSVDPWNVSELELSIARLAGLAGDPARVLDRAWGAAMADYNRTVMPFLIGELAAQLATLPDLEGARERIEEVASGHGGTRGEVYLAAFEYARGDSVAAEERMLGIASTDASARVLVASAVASARRRGDWEAARSYLDRYAAAQPTSDRRQVPTTLGTFGETQVLGLERGALFAAAGDLETAEREWRAALAREREGAHALARLFAMYGAWESSQAALDEHLGRSSATWEDYLLQARIHRELGRHAESIEALRLARELVPADQSVPLAFRAALITASRSAGKLGELRDELMAERELASKDASLAAACLNLTLELEGEEGVEAALADGSFDAAIPAVFLWRASRARDRGEIDVAIAELRAAGERGSHDTSELVTLLAQAGRYDEVLDAYASGSRSRAGDNALRFFIGERQWERALELLEESSKSDVSRRARVLLELSRPEEAAALVLAAIDRRGATRSSYAAELIGRIDRAVGLSERVERELAESPDDVQLRMRAGVVAYSLRRDTLAIEHLERVCDQEHPRELAMDLLWRASKRAGRLEDARTHLERWLEYLDRQQGFSERDRRLSGLRGERASLILATEGADAAIAAWSDSVGRRFAQIDPDDYEYDDLELDRDTELTNQLWRHGLFEEYLQVEMRQRALSDGRYRSGDKRLEALFRAGRRDEALEAVWRMTLDTTEDDSDSAWGMFSGRIPTGQGGGPELCARLWFEAGREAELERRLAEDPFAHLNPDKAVSVARALANITGNSSRLHAEVIANAADRRALYWIARDLYLTGHHDAAIAAWKEAPSRARDVFRVSGHREELPYFDEMPEPVRFLPGVGGTMLAPLMIGSSIYYFGNSGSGESFEADEDVTFSLAIAFRSGLREEALAAESAELERLARRGVVDPHEQLAGEYLDLDLFDEALRLYGGEGLTRVRPDLVMGTVAQLLECAHRLGRDSERERLVSRLTELWAEAELPVASALWRRAQLLATTGAPEAALRSVLAQARATDPDESEMPDGVAGWVELALSDYGDAIESFEAEIEEQRLLGRGRALPRYGLGFALAGAGRLEQARAVLRRALAQDPRKLPHAAAARELLGL